MKKTGGGRAGPATVLAILVLMAGCAVRNYLPRGPALSPEGMDEWLRADTAPVTYTGEARVPYPVPPFQVFALKYDEVFVLESENPVWSMHEYARVSLDGRPVWLINESDKAGVQTVTADLPDIRGWYPEIPVPRHRSPVEVQDDSGPGRFSVSLRYRDPAGQDTRVSLESPRPPEPARKRNGSTFNHSAGTLSALLDIPARQEHGTRAAIWFGGNPARVRRVLGLFPVRALLVQTQAGFAAASMRIAPAAAGWITVERPVPGTAWPSSSMETWRARPHRLSYTRKTGSWDYLLEDGGVAAAEVYQAGVQGPLFRVLLSAPLPDLSRPFQGPVRRRFAALMDGQCLGYGRMEAWTDAQGGACLDILPEAPRWFARRPLRTVVRFQGETADVETRRLPEP